MACLNSYVEGRARLKTVAGLGRGDDGRDHVGGGRDAAHGDAIAGAVCVLAAVGQRAPGAKVDKVCFIAARWEVSSLLRLEHGEHTLTTLTSRAGFQRFPLPSLCSNWPSATRLRLGRWS